MSSMFGRRRREQEPTHWYRLADSHELSTALHETPDGWPLLPTVGQNVSPQRRYVAMQPPTLTGTSLVEGSTLPGASHQHHYNRLLRSHPTTWASFSSAETVMRPFVPSNPYGTEQAPNKPLGLKLPVPHKVPLQQLLQPQWKLPQQLRRPMQPTGQRGQQTYAAGFESPSQAPSGAPSWSTTLEPVSPVPPPADRMAAAEGPNLRQGAFMGYTSPPRYGGAAPATAVAAVAAVEFGGSGSIVRFLQEPIRDPALAYQIGPPPVRVMANGGTAVMSGFGYQHPEYHQGRQYQEQMQQEQMLMQRPDVWRLQEAGLMQPGHQLQPRGHWRNMGQETFHAEAHRSQFGGAQVPPVGTAAVSSQMPTGHVSSPDHSNNISAIQQWLLLVPDHSKLALAKAWSASLQRAYPLVPSSFTGLAQQLRERREQLHAATIWLPAGVPAIGLPAKPPKPAAMMKEYLDLEYANYLHGEDQQDKLLDHGINSPSLGATMNDSSRKPAPAFILRGTQRLYNMYKQVLGLETHSKPSKALASEGSLPSELPSAKQQPSAAAQTSVHGPFTSDLGEHMSSSQALLLYAPKAGVCQAMSAAPNSDALPAPEEASVAATSPPTGRAATTPTATRGASLLFGSTAEAAAMPRAGRSAVAAGDGSGFASGQQRPATRWLNRERMEAVLAPVFVVDLDSGQVAITYINGRGRAEVETQTERWRRYDQAAVAAAGGDHLDSSSCGSQPISADGAHTEYDISGTNASRPDGGGAGDAASDTVSVVNAHGDDEPTRRVRGTGLKRLLKRVNVFRRWHLGRGTGQGTHPTQPSAKEAAATVADSRNGSEGSLDSSEDEEEGDDQGTPGTTPATTTAVVPASESAVSDDDGGVSTRGSLVGTDGDQQQQSSRAGEITKHQKQERKGKEKKSKNPTKRARSKMEKQQVVRGPSARSKMEKQQQVATVSSPDLEALSGTTGGVDAITHQPDEKYSKSKKDKSKAASRLRSSEASQAALVDGKGGGEDAALDSREEAQPVAKGRLKKSSGKKMAPHKPQAEGSTSKVRSKYRRFGFWKRDPPTAESTPSGVTLRAVAAGAGDDAHGQQLDNADSRGGKALKATKAPKAHTDSPAKVKSGALTASPPEVKSGARTTSNAEAKLDNQVQEGAELQKDNTGACSPNSGPLEDEIEAAAVGSEAAPALAVAAGGSPAGDQAEGSGGGKKRWMQRFYASAAGSVRGWLPKGKKSDPVSSSANSKAGKDKAAKRQKKENMPKQSSQPATATSSPTAAAAAGGAPNEASVPSPSSGWQGTGNHSALSNEDTLAAQEQAADEDVERPNDGDMLGTPADTAHDTSLPSKGVTGKKQKKKEKGTKALAAQSSRGAESESKEKAKGKPRISGIFARLMHRKRDSTPLASPAAIASGAATRGVNINQQDHGVGGSAVGGQSSDAAATPGHELQAARSSQQQPAATAVKDEVTSFQAEARVEAGDGSAGFVTEEDVGPVDAAPIGATAAGQAGSAVTAARSVVSPPVAAAAAAAPNTEIEAVSEQEPDDEAAVDSNETPTSIEVPNMEPAVDNSAGIKDLKGDGKQMAVGKKSKKAVKKALAAAAGEPLSALPPPKGPRAQLMQKLLKLSDVVSAQRAAAAAAKAAQRSGGGAAADASLAAVDRASGGGAADAGLEASGAARRGNVAEVGSSDLQQSGIATRTSSVSGVQQDEQQQQQATTASEATVSHLNKSSALERLKNTLMRTRRRSSLTEVGSPPPPVKVSARTNSSTARDSHFTLGAAAAGDDLLADERRTQQQLAVMKEPPMWGTPRARQPENMHPAEAESEPGSSPAKLRVMDRMMASLRRRRSQSTEVQEMVTFKEVEESKGFGAHPGSEVVDAHRAASTNSGCLLTSADPRSLAGAGRKFIAGGDTMSPPASPLTDSISKRTSRLHSMTRAGRPALHQGAEDLMDSIRKQKNIEHQEVDSNSSTARPSGTAPATSGGWAMQTIKSGGGGGGGSTPGSPLMQSLMRSTLNKTATIVRGHDASPSTGPSPLGSLRDTIVEEDGEGEGGDDQQHGAMAAMVEQLADLGLPPSKW